MKFASSLCAAFVAVAAIALMYSSTNDVQAYAPVVTVDEAAPVEDSMHEFMEYVFQPTYPRLKHSMMAVPADNKGWKAIKSDRRGVHQCSTFAG